MLTGQDTFPPWHCGGVNMPAVQYGSGQKELKIKSEASRIKLKHSLFIFINCMFCYKLKLFICQDQFIQNLLSFENFPVVPALQGFCL
jgi:hypothetical protein